MQKIQKEKKIWYVQDDIIHDTLLVYNVLGNVPEWELNGLEEVVARETGHGTGSETNKRIVSKLHEWREEFFAWNNNRVYTAIPRFG